METARGELDGRVALVTGAARGIGAAITDVLRTRGATVHAVDIAGDGCVHFDASTEEGARGMVDSAVDAFGRLDILVLNAGVQYVSDLGTFPVAEWDRLMSVMLRGPFIAIQQAWPHLVREPGGRIVATGSASSVVGEAHKAAYVAAKHGVMGLIKVAAIEGALHGLTANAVGPGWVGTELVWRQVRARMEADSRSESEVVAEMADRHPAKRFVDPSEVAEAVAFLASPGAGAISGHLLPIDFGTLAAW